MRPIDLTTLSHAVFEFKFPTERRINRSVAWLAVCKHCGKEQLVGAAQVKSGQHAKCIGCQKMDEITSRETE